jgi:hypothetical protein
MYLYMFNLLKGVTMLRDVANKKYQVNWGRCQKRFLLFPTISLLCGGGLSADC